MKNTIKIEVGQEIKINVDQVVKFYQTEDGSIGFYYVINGVEYALCIPNKLDNDGNCQLWAVGQN